MSAYPKFDPQGPCPKCGFGTVLVSYQNVGYSHLLRHQLFEEALLRRCERCEYSWPEACLDAVQLQHIQMVQQPLEEDEEEGENDQEDMEGFIDLLKQVGPRFVDEEIEEVAKGLSTALYMQDLENIPISDQDRTRAAAQSLMDFTVSLFWKHAVAKGWDHE